MPIHDDLDDRRSDADCLARCVRDLESTGNPLYAFEALQYVALPAPLARWVRASSAALLRPPERGGLRAKREAGPGEIGRALGFQHGLAPSRKRWGGAFDQVESDAQSLVDLMDREGLSRAAAAARLQKERGGSRWTWWRRLDRCNKYAKRAMQDRLRQAGRAVPRDQRELLGAYEELCTSAPDPSLVRAASALAEYIRAASSARRASSASDAPGRAVAGSRSRRVRRAASG